MKEARKILRPPDVIVFKQCDGLMFKFEKVKNVNEL